MRLTGVDASSSSLTGTLDLSGCDALEFLDCSNNQLTGLNLSSCTALYSLDCSNNLLSLLDLSDCTALEVLWCASNEWTFSTLPVSNAANNVDYSRQSDIVIPSSIAMGEMLDLSGEYMVQGERTVYTWRYALNNSVVPKNLYTETNGKFTFTYLTEGDLIYCTLTNDNFSGLKLKTTPVMVGTPVPVTGYNAHDLEKVTAAGLTNGQVYWTQIGSEMRLVAVDVAGNSRSGSLDLSGCDALVYVNCARNQLTSLNLSDCTALQTLRCSSNQLAALDVSGCTALESFDCSDNELVSLNVIGCTVLTTLDCSGNRLVSLDVSGCTSLETLYCYENQLAALEVAGCTALQMISCYGNELVSLSITGIVALESLYCGNNHLSSLDVSGCTALSFVDFSENPLTMLNISDCAALTSLDCSGYELTSLNIFGCTNLTSLDCSNNQLAELDVSECINLEELDCENNQLRFSTLNLPNHSISLFNCGNQALMTIDASLAIDEPLNLSSEYMIDGTATLYEWKYVGGSVVSTGIILHGDGTFTFDGLQNGDVVYCEMTNALYPGLTLQTTNVTISIPVASPTNLIFSAVGYDTVTLDWTASATSTVTGYTVQVSTDGGSTWTDVTVGGASVTGIWVEFTGTTTGIIRGLEHGETYQFHVIANTAIDHSEPSNVVVVETLSQVATAPSVVRTPSVKGTPTVNSITIQWTAPSDLGTINGSIPATIDHYVVRYATKADYDAGTKNAAFWASSDVHDAHWESGSTEAIASGLESGTEYVFFIVAVNSAGLSSTGVLFGTDGSIKTDALSVFPIAPPTSPLVKGHTSSSLTFAWTESAAPSADITGYTIEWYTTSNYLGTRAGSETVGTNVHEVVAEGLTADTDYYFRVKANAAPGNPAIEDSAWVNGTGKTDKIVLDTPTLKTTDTDSLSITISWNTVSNANLYLVKWGLVNDIEQATDEGETDTDHFVLYGLDPDGEQSFYFWVIARNKTDGCGYTNSLPLAVGKLISPKFEGAEVQLDTPVIKSAVAVETAVTLRWDSVLNGKDYLVEYRKIDNEKWIEHSDYTGTTEKVAVIDVLNPGQYEFRITALGWENTDMKTLYKESVSDIFSPVNVIKQLDAPMNLRVDNHTVCTLDLEWNKVEHATGYVIQWAKSATALTNGTIGTNLWAEVVGDVDRYMMENLEENTEYFIHIKAVTTTQGYGESAYSTYEVKASTVSPGSSTLDIPGNLTVGTKTSSTLNISWEKVPSATGYTIQWAKSVAAFGVGTDGEDYWQHVVENGEAESYLISNLVSGMEYFIRIKADCTTPNVNGSSYSSPVNGTTNTEPLTASSKPTGFLNKRQPNAKGIKNVKGVATVAAVTFELTGKNLTNLQNADIDSIWFGIYPPKPRNVTAVKYNAEGYIGGITLTKAELLAIIAGDSVAKNFENCTVALTGNGLKLTVEVGGLISGTKYTIQTVTKKDGFISKTAKFSAKTVAYKAPANKKVTGQGLGTATINWAQLTDTQVKLSGREVTGYELGVQVNGIWYFGIDAMKFITDNDIRVSGVDANGNFAASANSAKFEGLAYTLKKKVGMKGSRLMAVEKYIFGIRELATITKTIGDTFTAKSALTKFSFSPIAYKAAVVKQDGAGKLKGSVSGTFIKGKLDTLDTTLYRRGYEYTWYNDTKGTDGYKNFMTWSTLSTSAVFDIGTPGTNGVFVGGTFSNIPASKSGTTKATIGVREIIYDFDGNVVAKSALTKVNVKL
jgi:Leucine-rich repeat (LRR) protein